MESKGEPRCKIPQGFLSCFLSFVKDLHPKQLGSDLFVFAFCVPVVCVCPLRWAEQRKDDRRVPEIQGGN